jgi:hypothetical protein
MRWCVRILCCSIIAAACGDGHLVSDRACLLLRYLGLEWIADEALWLALDRGGQSHPLGAMGASVCFRTSATMPELAAIPIASWWKADLMELRCRRRAIR